MLSLWARAAQLRQVCACPQCAAHVAARRGAGSAARSTPRYLTSSTLWYSGIFATAATLDAARKDRRREHWDEVILRAKQDLESLGVADNAPSRLSNAATQLAGAAQPTPQLGSSAVQLDDAVLDSSVETTDNGSHVILDETNEHSSPFEAVPISTSETRRDHNEASDEEYQYLEKHLEGSRRWRAAAWPLNTGPCTHPGPTPPQSIYASNSRRDTREQTGVSEKKRQTIQLSIDLLQLRMFARLRELDLSREASQFVPATFGALLLQAEEEHEAMQLQKRDDLINIRFAHGNDITGWQRSAGDKPLCDYHQNDLKNVQITTHELNASLGELFKRHREGDIRKSTLLARIAYNLSLSPVAPNIDTYNELLLGFSRANETPLMKATIRSLRQTKMRPNEVTLSTILQFFTTHGEADRFRRWVGLIRGQFAGLMLARPDVQIHEGNHTSLKRWGPGGEKVMQLPNPAPMVLNAIIQGVLRFSGFDTALEVCRGFGQLGWGLCLRGMTSLLRDCANRSDWESGLAVWEQMQSLRRKGRRIFGWRSKAHELELPSFVAILRLCARCGQQERFNAVLTEALRVHKISLKDLMKLVACAPTSTAHAEVDPVRGEHGNEGMVVSELHMRRFLDRTLQGLGPQRGLDARRDARTAATSSQMISTSSKMVDRATLTIPSLSSGITHYQPFKS